MMVVDDPFNTWPPTNMSAYHNGTTVTIYVIRDAGPPLFPALDVTFEAVPLRRVRWLMSHEAIRARRLERPRPPLSRIAISSPRTCRAPCRRARRRHPSASLSTLGRAHPINRTGDEPCPKE